MRVLHLVDRWAGRGGAYRHLEGMLGRLERAGHTVAVAAGESAGPAPSRLYDVPGLDRRTREAVRLGPAVADFRPDQVHLHTVLNPAVLEWAASVPAVITIQDHRYFCPAQGKWTRRGSECRDTGGLQQKVVLAGVLAMGSAILVLDEPTSMFDLKDRREILALLRKLHDQGDRTIVHITHFLEEALHAKDLILLNRGRIEFCDSVARFLAREGWRADYGLALPPLQQLIRDLCAQGFQIPPEITSFPELKSLLLKMKAENGHTSE